MLASPPSPACTHAPAVITRRTLLAAAPGTVAALASPPTAAFAGQTPASESTTGSGRLRASISSPASGRADSRTDGATTIEAYLGAARSVLSELAAHEHDDYYLGTPYGNIGPGQMSRDLDSWDCWHPNGKPRADGSAYMNCTGFMVAVFEACGADCEAVGRYVSASMPSYDRGNKANLSRWKYFLDDNATMRTRYESKGDLLAGGALRKGDVIIAEPRDWSAAGADNHVMFFWGDAPDQDLAWHSSSKGDGVIAGTCPGNMISAITAKAANCYWFHVPLENFVRLTLSKRSADLNIADGGAANPAYSLSGAAFSVFGSYSDGVLSDFIASFTTDADGRAQVELPAESAVWVREDAPPAGFAPLSEPVMIKVGRGPQEAEIADSPCLVRVVIVKRDAERGDAASGWGRLEGAAYELVDANGESHLARTAYDEARGAYTAAFDAVPRGTARLREASPPSGYVIGGLAGADADGWVTVELAPDSHETVVEVVAAEHLERIARGDIAGVKFGENADESADTGLKSPLAGCRFALWLHDDGTLAAKGYDVADIVDASGAAVRDGTGAVRRGAFMGEVTSHDDGRFTSRDLLDAWIPDEHGGMERPEHALPFGRYAIVETYCPNPALRLIDPICDIEVATDGCEAFLALEDERIASPVRVRKIDAGSGARVLVPGTQVELLRRNDDGSYDLVEFEVRSPADGTVSRFDVPESGVVQFPEALPWGAYAIREAAAVPPYIVRTEPVYFEVDEHRDWGSGDVIEIDLPNEQATGAIEGLKVDAVDGTGVAGATYEVRAAEDIVSPDGTIQARGGDVMAEARTDDEGAWRVDGLPLGDGAVRYEVRETGSPDEYIHDTSAHSVTLSWHDDETPVVQTELSIEERPTVVRARKTAADTDEPIEGVKLAVYRVEEGTAGDGREDDADAAENTEDEAGVGTETKIDGENGVEDGGEPKRRIEITVASVDEYDGGELVAMLATNADGEACALRLARDATYRIAEVEAREDLGFVKSDEQRRRYLSPTGRWHESRAAWEKATQEARAAGEDPASCGDEEWGVSFRNEGTKVVVYKADVQSEDDGQAEDDESDAVEPIEGAEIGQGADGFDTSDANDREELPQSDSTADAGDTDATLNAVGGEGGGRNAHRLEGGLFELLDEDGKAIAPDGGGAETPWPATGDEPRVFSRLRPNAAYTLREIQAPDGYERATESFSFTVKPTAKTQVVVAKNRRLPALPKTSDVPWWAFGGAASIAAAACIAAFVGYSRRRSSLETEQPR